MNHDQPLDPEFVSPEEFASQQRQGHIESLNKMAENLSAMSRLGDRLAERCRNSAECLERGEVPEFRIMHIPRDEDNQEHTRKFMAHGEACGMLLQLMDSGCSEPFNENMHEFKAEMEAAKRKQSQQKAAKRTPRGMCKQCGMFPFDPMLGSGLCGHCHNSGEQAS